MLRLFVSFNNIFLAMEYEAREPLNDNFKFLLVDIILSEREASFQSFLSLQKPESWNLSLDSWWI